MAVTRLRNVRVPDELWDQAKGAAEERGENLSEVIRGFLTDYVGENLPGYTSGFVAGAEAVRSSAPTG